ncbi:MAG: hypothetical protein ABL986_24040 [Vicinamibacterales bacterium]
MAAPQPEAGLKLRDDVLEGLDQHPTLCPFLQTPHGSAALVGAEAIAPPPPDRAFTPLAGLAL